ncbi:MULTISPECIES: sensor domain-containing diguanylate cyclase [Methylobacterium]|nr:MULTISPECIES: sensor domain-containing diguanylate cyclase [Methylobacterium]
MSAKSMFASKAKLSRSVLADLASAATAPLRKDRASLLIARFGIGVTACLAILGAYLIYDLRDGAWRRAETNAQNLLGMIEEAVSRNVVMYDLSLQAAAVRATQPNLIELPPDLRREVLFDNAASAAGLGVIALVDSSGQVQITSDPETTSRHSVADLPEFQRLKADPQAGLVITGPRTSRISGRSIMGLSRPIVKADGTFGGMVSGAIHLSYFQSQFARLRIDPGAHINVFHQDGTLMLRHPYGAGYVGRNVADGPAFLRHREERRGMFVGTSTLDGKDRLYAFANLEGLPLVVNVSTGVDSIRAVWLSKALWIAALILGLICVTLGSMLVLHREMTQRTVAEDSARTANAELSRLALTDSLTGLPNRRRYDAALDEAWQRAVRHREPIALLLLDADHFKRFNDHFGHHRGDAVLQALAACVLQRLAGLDAVACRIGGEEFAVILSGLPDDAVRALADRIRRAVVGLQIAHATDVGGVATISVGLACRVPGPGDDAAALFADADAALYAAKRAGRNRVRAAAHAAPAEPVALTA